jgi:hypothetical protein
MSKGIFRKEALEKLSSPEQLDRLMKIVGLRGWIALVSLIGILVLVGVWSVTAQVPILATGKGIFFDQPTDHHPLIYAFAPAITGEKIQPGMRAKMDLDSVDAGQYGLLEGVVQKVILYGAATREEWLQSLPSKELRDFLLSDRESVLVVIEPISSTTTVSGFQWTSQKGPPAAVQPGTMGEVKIVIENKKPISYVFPNL